jgi:hypothetical protein
MNPSRWLGLALAAVWFIACASEPTRPVHESDKPTAPVSVKAVSTDLGGGRYEVRVVATPTTDVRLAQLRLLLPAGVSSEEDDQPIVFRAVSSGRALTLVRHLHLKLDGADVVADVRVDSGAGMRNTGAAVRLGKPAPARPSARTTRVVLPNGDVVEEVRQ